jgi:hypothetical protein
MHALGGFLLLGNFLLLWQFPILAEVLGQSLISLHAPNEHPCAK